MSVCRGCVTCRSLDCPDNSNMKELAIWIVRIIGLMLIGYGLLTEFFYITFSWQTGPLGEYSLSFLLYPLIYPAIGLGLIISSRWLVTRIWSLFNEDPYP